MKTNQRMMPCKTVFAARQSVTKENSYELFIYDDITKYGEFNWETWDYDESETSANHIRDILEQIPENMNLDIHINSNGGEVYEAVAIYNLLRQNKSYKTAYVDGVAHSAAFILLFACDHVVMGLGTACLLHNMWAYASGNAKQLRQAADRLDAMMESNRKIYMERAKNITEEELQKLMDEETILTPEKCMELGFCDEIGKYTVDIDQEKKNSEMRMEQLKQLAEKHEYMRQQMLKMKKEEEETTKKEAKQLALNFVSAFLNATTIKEEKRC